jgi:hypothetical protein
MLKQGVDEDIGSFGARTQLVFNQLAMLQAPRSSHQQCAAFVRGIVSLSQNRRDLLRFVQHSSFETVVAQARQFEQEDVVQQRQQRDAAGRHQQNAAAAANLADSGSDGGDRPKKDFSEIICHSCNKAGHISRHCPQKTAESMNATCGWCGVRGHLEAHCHKKLRGCPKTAAEQNAADKGKQASFAQSSVGFSGSVQANLFERVSLDSAVCLAYSGANALRDVPIADDKKSHFSKGPGAIVPIHSATGADEEKMLKHLGMTKCNKMRAPNTPRAASYCVTDAATTAEGDSSAVASGGGDHVSAVSALGGAVLWELTEQEEADLLTKPLGHIISHHLCQLIARESPLSA